MSLINDALRKAQKQRTGESPSLASLPGIGGETPHRIAKRAKPAGFETLILRAGLGAGIALLLVVGGYFAFRSSPAPSSDVQAPSSQLPAPSSPLPASPPQVSSPAIGQATAGGFRSQVSEPPPAAPAFTLPVAPVPAPGSQASVPALDPQVSSPAIGQATAGGFSASVSRGENRGQTPGGQQSATARSQVSAPPAPVVSAPTGSDPRVSPFSPPSSSPQTPDPKPQIPVSAGPPLKLEPRAIQFIENIKVGAIMARTASDAKVLMNDRVYRIGSLVEAEMGLTLVEITTGSLTFEDERGGRYTRTF